MYPDLFLKKNQVSNCEIDKSLSLSPPLPFSMIFSFKFDFLDISKKERENDKDFFETQKIFHFIYFTFSETKNRKHIEGLRWLNQTKKLSELKLNWIMETTTTRKTNVVKFDTLDSGYIRGKKSNDDDDEKEKFSIQKMFRITTITVAWFVLFVIAWLFCWFVYWLWTKKKHWKKRMIMVTLLCVLFNEKPNKTKKTIQSILNSIVVTIYEWVKKRP